MAEGSSRRAPLLASGPVCPLTGHFTVGDLAEFRGQLLTRMNLAMVGGIAMAMTNAPETGIGLVAVGGLLLMTIVM